MKNNIENYIRKSFLFFAMSSMLILNATNTVAEKEKSIQELLEDQNPTISFSFSKDIIDFFDTDVDWKNKKKHIEGDFSKAAFFAFDENSSLKDIDDLFKSQNYSKIKIEDEESNDGEITIYVKSKGKDTKEAHFVIQNEGDVVVFSLYGKMRLKEKN